MDKSGIETLKLSLIEENIQEGSFNIRPIPGDIPEEGVRFLGIQTLYGVTDRDIIRALRASHSMANQKGCPSGEGLLLLDSKSNAKKNVI